MRSMERWRQSKGWLDHTAWMSRRLEYELWWQCAFPSPYWLDKVIALAAFQPGIVYYTQTHTLIYSEYNAPKRDIIDGRVCARFLSSNIATLISAELAELLYLSLPLSEVQACERYRELLCYQMSSAGSNIFLPLGLTFSASYVKLIYIYFFFQEKFNQVRGIFANRWMNAYIFFYNINVCVCMHKRVQQL